MSSEIRCVIGLLNVLVNLSKNLVIGALVFRRPPARRAREHDAGIERRQQVLASFLRPKLILNVT
jgi:hypothetical protein